MLVRVDPARPDQAIITRAAEILRGGGLVAFPTETVYGLGASALDADAVDRIFEAKGRPSYNPLIVHIADAALADQVAREWPDAARKLARAFWPGPVTLVVPKRPNVPANVTAGLDTVGVRVPEHPVAHALLAAAGIPIAAPSANRSTEVSPTTGWHVEQSLGQAVDLVLDAGSTRVGIESTVIDVTVDPPVILRPGMISAADVARVVGRVLEGVDAPGDAHEPRKSPGTLDRHYAPRAALVLADTEQAAELAHGALRDGRRVGVLWFSPDVGAPDGYTICLPPDPVGYAARLYAALHELDDDAVELIVVEEPPHRPEWRAVLDRLERAARR